MIVLQSNWVASTISFGADPKHGNSLEPEFGPSVDSLFRKAGSKDLV